MDTTGNIRHINKTRFMRSFRFQNIFRAALALPLLALLLVSCKDEGEIRPETISDVIQNDSRFTVLRSVLKQGGMSDALRTGSYTLFAPTDEAFRKMSITDPGQVGSLSRDSLRAVVQYLMLDSLHLAKDFDALNKKQIKAFDNSNLFITKDAGRFLVNMANVIQADIMADNGVIHAIDHVPSTSKFTLAGWISANPSFSFFAEMATRAFAANPDLANQLTSENSSFTLFAPANEAFIASGFATIDDITNSDPVILTSILTAHILPKAYFTTDLATGQYVSVGGHPLLIGVDGKITVSAEQNSGTLPTITRSDILTKNGIIHVVDRVLLP